MKINEAIVYILANYGRGLTTDRIAQEINRHRLHIRLDGTPVTSAQVYAVTCRYHQIFTKEGGLIRLIM